MDDEVREALLNLRDGGRQLIETAESYLADEQAAARDGARLIQFAEDVTQAGRNLKYGT